MAEFCLDCLNKDLDRNDSERDYVLSKEETLCEGCAEWRHVVIRERYFPFLFDIRRMQYVVFYVVKKVYHRYFLKNLKNNQKRIKKNRKNS